MGAPGCDDAPLIDIGRGREAKPVTMIYPYYDNPDFFSKQLGGWLGYPKELQDRLTVIVVDDGSPTVPASSVIVRQTMALRLRVFRIDVDVRWNWLAARNIGAHHAESGWMMLTDMDHVLSEQAMEMLQFGEHDPGVIYRFSRLERGEALIHPHPNSWFMTRKMYWKIGGYDERMSGYYGSDSYYRRRCAATAPIRIMRNVWLSRHEHEGDSSTVRYKRKQPEDAALRPLARGLTGPPKVLSFPYHEETL